MSFYIREDMADVTLTLDGLPWLDTLATFSGGELAANDAKTRPGGMGKEVNVGGPASRGDATATIQFTDVIAAQHKHAESRIGKGVVEINVAWLDEEAAVIQGASIPTKGKLKSASHPPTTNSDSPAVGMYTVVISCDEEAS
jgi:hypothetical protein